MRQPIQRSKQGGFTLLELSLAVVLLAIVAVKAQGALSAVSTAVGGETNQVVLEDQARRVLRQIGFAVMGSNRESLMPSPAAPLSTDDIFFQVNLGINDGEVVWSPPERVALDSDAMQVFWSQNPETDAERKVIWTSLVTPFLEGELPNGIDDNGNGLIDESGLSFDVEGDSVTIHLTLERMGPNGESQVYSDRTVVTCRNVSGADA